MITPLTVARMLRPHRAAPEQTQPVAATAAEFLAAGLLPTPAPAPEPAPTFEVPENLNGCQHCDIPPDQHGTRYSAIIGHHEWWKPGPHLVEDRRNAQQNQLAANGDAR